MYAMIRLWERLYSMVHGWMRRVSHRLVSGRRKKRGAIHQPFYGTWMLRQDAGRFKYLSDKNSHGSEGDDWEWHWQRVRQQPVF